MSASAAAAVSASAAAISASVAAQAHREACRATMVEYDGKTATVEQKQAYAGCVRALHPESMDPGSIVALKVVFVIAVLCGAAGAWVEWQSPYSDFTGSGLMFWLWFLLGPLMLGCVGGLFYGVYWVLT